MDKDNVLLPSDLRISSQSDERHLWGYLQPCNQVLTRIDLLKNHPKYTVGRHAHTCQIVLPGFKISGTHCMIMWDGGNSSSGGVLITDLSSNGTFINGARIGKNRTCVLNEGNIIAFGTANPQPQNNGLEDYRYVFHRIAAEIPRSGFDSHYDVGAEIGQGAFAIVRKAVHRETGTLYAVKMIAAAKTVSAGVSMRDRNAVFGSEISILDRLDHRNICKFVEAYLQQDGSVYLVLELVEGGDLLKYVLNTKDGVEELPAKGISLQICNALAYIHSEGITHRDMKLENVLLTRDTPPVVKVADFGLAKVVDSMTMLRTMCGTPSYLAPEVVADYPNGYNNLVDSWSVGVIVFSMLTKEEPFRHEQESEVDITEFLDRRVEWSVLDHTSHSLSLDVKDFVKALLQDNPRQRMSLTTACQHRWFRPTAEEDTGGQIGSESGSPSALCTPRRKRKLRVELTTLPEESPDSGTNSRPMTRFYKKRAMVHQDDSVVISDDQQPRRSIRRARAGTPYPYKR